MAGKRLMLKTTWENPFREGPDKCNRTQVMLAIRSDPSKAIDLCLEAGFYPQQFGIDPAKYGIEIVNTGRNGS